MMREGIHLVWDHGGLVGVALLAVSFLMWWVVFLRAQLLRRGTREPVASVIDRCANGSAVDVSSRRQSALLQFIVHACEIAARHRDPLRRIDALHSDVAKGLKGWRTVLGSLVATAPLLGLLGTVGGMIETFSTLHKSGLAHADASVAGGISTALLTTQLGLLVSVPGLVAARLLERLEARRLGELDEARGALVLRMLGRESEP